MMPSLTKDKNGKLQPYSEKKRTKCPFYGFNNYGKDSEGDQCALIANAHIPCQREIRQEKPVWNKCFLNTEENRDSLAKILEKVKVFPKEFRPPEARSWGGIYLKDWANYILDDQKQSSGIS